MSNSKPIRTVRELMAHLGSCNPDSAVLLMPEQEDGFFCGGVLQFSNKTPPEVWILIDEYTDLSEIEEEGVPLMEWQGGGNDDDPEDEQENTERPGDMACALQTEVPEEDVVVVRGNMRSA